jgi:CheY-like chemotaxis protein
MDRQEASHSLRGVYVLLVDDQPAHRAILRDVLRYCGAFVREVDGAAEAHAVLRETTPTVLVVRLRRRGDDPWALVRDIRAMRPEHGGKLTVIGVGPSALTEDAQSKGVDGYVVEPLDAMALCRTVAQLTE